MLFGIEKIAMPRGYHIDQGVNMRLALDRPPFGAAPGEFTVRADFIATDGSTLSVRTSVVSLGRLLPDIDEWQERRRRGAFEGAYTEYALRVLENQGQLRAVFEEARLGLKLTLWFGSEESAQGLLRQEELDAVQLFTTNQAVSQV